VRSCREDSCAVPAVVHDNLAVQSANNINDSIIGRKFEKLRAGTPRQDFVEDVFVFSEVFEFVSHLGGGFDDLLM
jgi:hypothetical protein